MKTQVRKIKADSEAQQAILAERKKLVDEFGRLDAELSPLKGKLRRMEELAKIVRSWHDDADPELTVSSAGERFEVVLGPRGMQTRIDVPKAYRLLGREKFIEAASLTLRALEERLNATAIAALICKERTGARQIVVRSVATQDAA